jgi:hypothetical protein
MASFHTSVNWNAEVSKALLELNERVAHIDEDRRRQLHILIGEIESLASQRPQLFGWSRLREWWTGGRLDLLWSLIHEAQLQLLAVAPISVMRDLLEIVVEHSENLPPNDTARLRLIDFIKNRMKGPLSHEDIGVGISWP